MWAQEQGNGLGEGGMIGRDRGGTNQFKQGADWPFFFFPSPPSLFGPRPKRSHLQVLRTVGRC